MKKIIFVLLLIFVIGCSNEEDSKEQRCLDINLTIDHRYVMQDDWVRCCSEYEPAPDGMYKNKCENYRVKVNKFQINSSTNG